MNDEGKEFSSSVPNVFWSDDMMRLLKSKLIVVTFDNITHSLFLKKVIWVIWFKPTESIRSRTVTINPQPKISKNKSAGGGPWPPTWVTWQIHEAKTVFLLTDIPIYIVFDMYTLASDPGWRPDWFRDILGEIHCEIYRLFSAPFKNSYWQKCWSLLPRFWRTLLP